MQALAYKKFQHVPLYLEWAPKDIFSTPPPSQPIKAQAQATVAAAQEAAATAAAQQEQQAKHEAAQSSKAVAQPEVVAGQLWYKCLYTGFDCGFAGLLPIFQLKQAPFSMSLLGCHVQ